jgi:hypothetical protein
MSAAILSSSSIIVCLSARWAVTLPGEHPGPSCAPGPGFSGSSRPLDGCELHSEREQAFLKLGDLALDRLGVGRRSGQPEQRRSRDGTVGCAKNSNDGTALRQLTAPLDRMAVAGHDARAGQRRLALDDIAVAGDRHHYGRAARTLTA